MATDYWLWTDKIRRRIPYESGMASHESRGKIPCYLLLHNETVMPTIAEAQDIKRRLHATEGQEQSTVFKWAQVAMNQHPELFYLHHIPNGGSRHPIEAVNLKRQGVKRGVPDLCLPVSRGGHHGLYIEMKAQHGKLSPEQSTWLEHLRAEGYRAEVAFGAEQAINIITQYLQREDTDEHNDIASEVD